MDRRKRSAGLLHVVVGLFVIAKSAEYYRYLSYRNFIAITPFLLVGIAAVLYGLLRKRIDPAARYNQWMRGAQVAAFVVLGILMIDTGRPVDYSGVFIFALLCLILYFSERRLFLATAISFEAAGIRIPAYYRDHVVGWDQLSDVVVREDFITLFHVRQKYLQYQVTQDLSPQAAATLNAFCKQHVRGVAVPEA